MHKVSGAGGARCSGAMPSVSDIPDVAAALFTSQHRAVKLAGKRALSKAPPGTGSVRGLCCLSWGALLSSQLRAVVLAGK